MRAGAVDENPAHHLRRHTEELRAILPGGPVLIDQPQVRLVDERGRLQRMPRALAAELGRGAPPELLVHEGNQTIARACVPGAPRVEQRCDIAAGSSQGRARCADFDRPRQVRQG